jgi:hypothetical protein
MASEPDERELAETSRFALNSSLSPRKTGLSSSGAQTWTFLPAPKDPRKVRTCVGRRWGPLVKES